jgi:serine/threonine-protein kinase
MSQTGPEVAGVREGDILAGKYRVERILGVGGMGVVVAAHHMQLDEKVALKFLLPDALGHPEAVARFAREARAAVKIKSEHVARVSDVGTLPNGSPYMVMEYLEGGDLSAWIRQRGALPIEQAIEFVLQACVAVADAHALGIVHRDLKPANLFCIRRSDGQLTIKVLDFGISKMNDANGLGGSGSVTRTSALMGSPLYMSPEQMRSSRDVDAQTDIWALGIILFELITGRPAFVAESVTELAIKVASEPTPTIQSLRAEVPPGVEAIVSRCLEKDRRRRFANVAELAVALLPFAPKRARASVERITGIIQGAGMSPGGFGNQTQSATGIGGTQAFEGTLPPAVGRTTTGSSGHKAATIGVSILAGLALVAGVGTVILLKRTKASEDAQAAAVQAASPPPPAVSPVVTAPVDPPKAAVAPPQPETATPPPAEAPVAAPEPAVTAKKKAAVPVPAAPSKAAPAPAPSPAAAKCDPPYYFDANGNRMFKKECL